VPRAEDNIAELREAKELTQSGLAERLGLSQPNVSKLEAAAASPHAGASAENSTP
jgi:transcriptional regulator with XRE-family HTH domain